MESVRMLLAPVAVIGLALLARWFLLRRRGTRLPVPGRWFERQPARLQSLARLALSPQHSLHLVRCGGREFLVAAGPSVLRLMLVAERPTKRSHRGRRSAVAAFRRGCAPAMAEGGK